jgi:tetratricopeptide (TPR) repeat protein
VKLHGEEHAGVAMSYARLGHFWRSLNEPDQALELFKKSLALELTLYGEEHADVAESYLIVGITCLTLGEHAQALKYLEKSLAIELMLHGEEHPYVARSYRLLGSLFETLGDSDRAREHLEKALAIQVKLHGEEHADVASCRDLLGDLLVKLDLKAKAQAHYELAATHGNGWSMWKLAQYDLGCVVDEAGAERLLSRVRGAAEFGVQEAKLVLEGTMGMGPMEIAPGKRPAKGFSLARLPPPVLRCLLSSSDRGS